MKDYAEITIIITYKKKHVMKDYKLYLTSNNKKSHIQEIYLTTQRLMYKCLIDLVVLIRRLP